MYLKRLELVGFKSFAEKTRLEFGPGLMAIVGPNGCGKSNIADAIRWVLGEQNARMLRGAKMEDCIFSGTDQHRALGLAEVSLTLAECESVLGTEYHEVTVTRRVYRSGEGEYLVNKTPCRLKDIQRLFMDTGVGTNSYSLMEQGRIDRVLSSRPEDRRAVFEEASGITKFKADKKEALRKLEHTEANLLRLADIVREVKRQIISLQRQAGKARRYQQLMEQLRSHDLYLSREKMKALDGEVATLEAQRASLAEREEAAAAQVAETEQRVQALRSQLDALDREVEETREHMLQAQAEWERTKETIDLNDVRITELTEIAQRDSAEAEKSRGLLAEQRAALEEVRRAAEQALGARAAADREMADKTAGLKTREDRIAGTSGLLRRLRTEGLELDTRFSGAQQELAELDARDREASLRRERLGAERAGLQRSLDQFEQRRRRLGERIAELAGAARRQAEAEAGLERERDERDAALAELRRATAARREQAAARRARIETLQRSEQEGEGYPRGARWLLDDGAGSPRTGVLGALAAHLEVDAADRVALEAALRPWLDAVLVRDPESARRLLEDIAREKAGSARLVAAPAGAPPPAPAGGPGEPLLARVRGADPVRAALAALVGHVRIVERLSEVPQPVPAGAAYVTRDGLLVVGAGAFESWRPEAAEANPVARRQAIRQWTSEAEALEREIEADAGRARHLEAAGTDAGGALRDARAALELARREVALAEGENQVLTRESEEARRRVETVAFEIEALAQQGSSGEQRREALAAEIRAIRERQEAVRVALHERTASLHEAEQERNRWLSDVTDARVAANDRRREVEALEQRQAAQRARIAELEATLRERSGGVTSYRARIEDLHRASAAARDNLQPLEDEVNLHKGRLEGTRHRREAAAAEVARAEQGVHDRRKHLDEVRQARGGVDVQLAEQRLRRQNLLERTSADYRVTPEQVLGAPDPDWGEAGPPADREAVESTVAELRAKIDAMGPVNLVAIEEHRELEQRFEFLTKQQDDLVQSKQQLMDLIRRINRQTTDMFAETFAKVNANFQGMFARLFGGGTAKLVLVDEQDVLESGIEIIARPPGKKLQSVSLLSGGERTMTAVALLFALYLVKPSPFCMLDELDAALDDANIGRFVEVVQGFVRQSQFVVITHNRRTIAAANALFGVTMEKQGISKIVSVKFNPEGRVEGEPAARELPAEGEAEPVAVPAHADAAPPAGAEAAAPAPEA